jgi:hypothetical protein
MSSRPRQPRSSHLAWAALAPVALLVMSTSGGGSTYAGFTDFVVDRDHRVGASQVRISWPTGSELRFHSLESGVARSDTVRVRYDGVAPGDVTIAFRSGGDSSLCERDDGAWMAAAGTALEVTVGDGWRDYCALLDGDVGLVVARDLEPGNGRDVEVGVRWSGDVDAGLGAVDDTDELVVTARPSAGSGEAFADWATGAVSWSVGP